MLAVCPDCDRGGVAAAVGARGRRPDCWLRLWPWAVVSSAHCPRSRQDHCGKDERLQSRCAHRQGSSLFQLGPQSSNTVATLETIGVGDPTRSAGITDMVPSDV